jgi:hypothetical protein
MKKSKVKRQKSKVESDQAGRCAAAFQGRLRRFTKGPEPRARLTESTFDF